MTFAERCAEGATRPLKMRVQSANAPLGGNSPTEVCGKIENTPGNTFYNRAMGGIVKEPGFASKTGQYENPNEWILQTNLAISEIATGTDRSR